MQTINKRLKNDHAQSNADKVKFKRLFDNEMEKNKKRLGNKDDLDLAKEHSGGVPLVSQSVQGKNLANLQN